MTTATALRVRLFRGEQCLTRAELARRCSVPPAVIAAVEAGERQPWPALQTALARALGVDADRMLEQPVTDPEVAALDAVLVALQVLVEVGA